MLHHLLIPDQEAPDLPVVAIVGWVSGALKSTPDTRAPRNPLNLVIQIVIDNSPTQLAAVGQLID